MTRRGCPGTWLPPAGQRGRPAGGEHRGRGRRAAHRPARSHQGSHNTASPRERPPFSNQMGAQTVMSRKGGCEPGQQLPKAPRGRRDHSAQHPLHRRPLPTPMPSSSCDPAAPGWGPAWTWVGVTPGPGVMRLRAALSGRGPGLLRTRCQRDIFRLVFSSREEHCWPNFL